MKQIFSKAYAAHALGRPRVKQEEDKRHTFGIFEKPLCPLR